jgi:hypothetical protein
MKSKSNSLLNSAFSNGDNSVEFESDACPNNEFAKTKHNTEKAWARIFNVAESKEYLTHIPWLVLLMKT